MPLQFAVAVLAARALPASDFGVATLLLSIQAIYLGVTGFGYDEALQRAVAGGGGLQQQGTYVATALKGRASAAGCALGLGLLGACVALVLGDQGVAQATFALSVGSAATLLSLPLLSLGFALYRVAVPAAASVAAWTVPAALLAVGQVSTVNGYLAALAVGAVARLVLSTVWLLWASGLPPVDARAVAGAPWLLLTRSGHLSLATFGITNLVLARHGDVFMAGLAGLSTVAIGTYGLAYQITATAGQFLLLGIGALGLTRLSELREDPSAVRRSWVQLTRLAAVLALAPLCTVVLLAPEVASVVGAGKYPELVGLIQALALALWAGRLGGAGTTIGVLIALGMASHVARSAIVAASLNLGLAFGLAVAVGVYGLPIATGLVALVVGAWNTVAAARNLRGAGDVALLGGRAGLLRLVPLRLLLGLSAVMLIAVAVGTQADELVARALVLVAILVGWVAMLAREVTWPRSGGQRSS